MKALKYYLPLLFYVISILTAFAQKQEYKNRRLLLRDEGLTQLSYVDLANPKNNWYLPVPAGRDLQ